MEKTMKLTMWMWWWPALVVLCADGAMAQRGDEAPPRPVVESVQQEVSPQVEKHLSERLSEVNRKLGAGKRWPSRAKTPLRLKGLEDPWGAMADLEAYGLAVARAAGEARVDPAAVLNAMAAALGKPAGKPTPVAPPSRTELPELGRYITAVLAAARVQRDHAVRKLKPRQQKFMVNWAPNLIVNYGPQIPFNAQAKPVLQKDLAFVSFIWDDTDWSAFTGAAATLCVFTENKFIQRVKAACFTARASRARLPGVTGTLYYQEKTEHGWILIGGKGKNKYALEEPVAVLVDLGGDDTYLGRIASSHDPEHPFGVVVDLAGNDTYTPSRCGLATGRLGVGLLHDLAGNDRYHLSEGSGGVGLGGIGVLIDERGDDVYTGSRFTQGAAVAGLGLLLDRRGNDRHTAFGYAVGLGGSAGVGAVVDVEGNDAYQCGNKYPSGYNQLEKPPPKSGDPRFQWTAFGMGTGLGRRIVGTTDPRHHQYALAGGVGMVIDVAGDDTYASSNFSQGCGYYFGAGLKLDLDGDDSHGAARYGHAAGAHFGMGLFVDYRGCDRYASTGPTYNLGCAWDHSIFVCIDAGATGDTYDLTRSAGLGRADIDSWAVFADLGGADRYLLRNRPGRASRTGVGVFYDREGADEYIMGKKKNKKNKQKKGKSAPENGQLAVTEQGGMFWDRKDEKRR